MSRDYLPECWNDDTRMNALFASFRGKEVNPQDWESKIQFWRNCIWQWCQSTKRLCFNQSTLISAFERNGKVPQGIRIVINEMLRQGQLMRLSNFGKFSDGDSWSAWGLNVLVKRPLSWSWNQISTTVTKKEPLDEEYVFVELLKNKAEKLLKWHESQVQYEATDHILEVSTIWEHCKEFFCSEEELELVIVYLRQQKQLGTHADGSIKVVKFCSKDHKGQPHLTDVDIGILRLKKSRECLQSRIFKIQDDIEKHLNEARQHLQQNAKAMAKQALRRKKTAEKVLAKRETALENIEELLHKIQEVESDKMVIDAYRAGVDGFRKTLAESGITIDKVDDTMVAIQEVFDMHEEIQDSISHPMAGDVDLSDLDAELEELMLSEEVSPPPPTSPSYIPYEMPSPPTTIPSYVPEMVSPSTTIPSYVPEMLSPSSHSNVEKVTAMMDEKLNIAPEGELPSVPNHKPEESSISAEPVAMATEEAQ